MLNHHRVHPLPLRLTRMGVIAKDDTMKQVIGTADPLHCTYLYVLIMLIEQLEHTHTHTHEWSPREKVVITHL